MMAPIELSLCMHEESSRARWLLVASVALFVFAAVRSLSDLTSRTLPLSKTSVTTSCGNALSWLDGADAERPHYFPAWCVGTLRSASIDAVAALVVAGILLMVWLLLVRASQANFADGRSQSEVNRAWYRSPRRPK